MNETYFSQINSEDKAYWLGFMFADGCVYEQKNGRKVISMSQKEADHPASFLASIGSDHRVGKCTSKNGTWHRVNVYSEQMFKDLVGAGCTPAKSKTLIAPTVDLGLFTRDFIRGYNDGDGGFYAKTRRMKMRGTVEFLTWVKEQLPAGSLLYPQGPTAQLFVCKQTVLRDTIKYLYEGATIYLPRKREVAMLLS